MSSTERKPSDMPSKDGHVSILFSTGYVDFVSADRVTNMGHGLLELKRDDGTYMLVNMISPVIVAVGWPEKRHV